ncbi:LLM class flavin-dependent oxidoreductase [Xylophilus sp.]|uniref:LLM class flavin-dependent oxidoreductase n=1 Tax=Xylophilus sp. TaxID=2653893 RepID=UPI0013BE4215|nr:LLM class flavin-dependent oxidoreductase [Xylophilus sp.]KAF1049500.1 MAG: Alkanal monooxygenase alpha chain [Xylophilus sp.]
MTAGTWRLGFLSRSYSPDAPAQALHDTLALFAAAESWGYDSGWVAQHHFGVESGRLPSPLVLLAAAAERTRRLRLGTAVVVLPLEQPLRLAEDAAVVDALSDGRLELGLGAGFDPDVFAAFGQRLEDRHAAHDAALAALRAALAGRPLPGAPGLALQPPAPGLAGRLWQATTGDVEAVARRGHGLIVARTRPGGPPETELARRYRAAHAAAWGTDGPPPRLALVRAVVPGDSAAAVEAELAPDILRYVQRLARATGGAPPQQIDTAAALDQLGVVYGPAARITRALQEDTTLPLATDFIVQVQTESTSRLQALTRLAEVARIVAAS